MLKNKAYNVGYYDGRVLGVISDKAVGQGIQGAVQYMAGFQDGQADYEVLDSAEREMQFMSMGMMG